MRLIELHVANTDTNVKLLTEARVEVNDELWSSYKELMVDT